MSYAGGDVEKDVAASFLAERLRSWDLPLTGRRGWLSIA